MVARDMARFTATAGSRRARHRQLLLIPRLQMLTLSHLGSRPWLLPLPVPLLGAAVVAVVGGLHVRCRRGSGKRGEGVGLDGGPLRILTLRALCVPTIFWPVAWRVPRAS
jgi:hypothetical protein